MIQALLQDWEAALKGAEIVHIQQLLDNDPTLLWQPLPFNELDYPKTMSHFKDTSHQYFKDMTITHIYGIQLLMIILFEKSLSLESDEAKLLSILIGYATAADLNTCFWGSTKNTTLHLASNLGQPIATIQQLLDQGALADMPNNDGYFANDISFTNYEMDPLSSTGSNNSNSNTSNTNSSTKINRFKQLRQLAEDGGSTISSTLSPTANISTKRQNSTRRYFQPGHLEERRRKVLQEEDDDDAKLDHDEDKNMVEKRKGKTNTKRQQEVESLAKQSRVRNNPLLKKFEEQHQQQQERSLPQSAPLSAAARARRNFLEPALEKSNDRRASKGITSLKDRSFVSASVFRRQQQDIPNDNDYIGESDKANHPSVKIKQDNLINTDHNTFLRDESELPLSNDDESISPTNSKIANLTPIDPTGKHVSDDDDDTPTPIDRKEKHPPDNESISPTNSKIANLTPIDPTGKHVSDDDNDTPTPIDRKEKHPPDDDNDTTIPTSKVDDSSYITINDMKSDFPSTSADAETLQNINDHPPASTTIHTKHVPSARKSHQSLASDNESEQWFDSYEEYAENEARKSAILLNNSYRQSLLTQNTDQISAIANKHDDNSTKETCTTSSNVNSTHRLSHETEESQEVFKFQSPPISEDESVNTWLPPSPKSYFSDYKDVTIPPVPSLPEIALPAHTSPVLQPPKKNPPPHHIEAIDSTIVVRRLSLCHKKNDITTTNPLSSSSSESNGHGDIRQYDQQQQQERSTTPKEDIQPLTDNIPHPIMPLIPETRSSYGKIYIRMTQARDILLPLPIETTYVRCVISDGRQEYISRYEVLTNKVQFHYECTLDTYPNMIISVALQVRPDPHVRPLTGLFNRLLFTSVYRQKKTLLGYVHPEDYIIGQARFALEDMTPVCNQKTYSASFDCFNSWFVQSMKERRRATATTGGQIIKVVGQLAVDILYLPVSDPSMSIPNSLQECDLALRIRQWHGTCWCRGYLSTRQKDDKLWNRQYYRLIGSRLLGFHSANDGTSFTHCHDITDAVQLTVAAEQVLVDTKNMTNTAQPNQCIFTQNTICEDNRRGFFRVTFSNGSHIDCVSDHACDSEVWVRTLRAMIGRVPLTVSAAVFLE